MTVPAVALVGLLAALAVMTVVWLVSLRLGDASIVDACWGPGFALLAWGYLLVPGGAPGARPPAVTATDVAGLALFGAGFAFEAAADAQLRRFKASPGHRGKVLDTGLWRYTRHPNYFGDALLWWGLYLMAASARGGWRTLASPALMTFLLLRVSGVTLLERGLRSSKPAYADYAARTSAFLPWFPKR